jgi:hypothetical protein
VQHQPTDQEDNPDSWQQLAFGRRRSSSPWAASLLFLFLTQNYLHGSMGVRGRQKHDPDHTHKRIFLDRGTCLCTHLVPMVQPFAEPSNALHGTRTPSRLYRRVYLYLSILDACTDIKSDSFINPQTLLDGPDTMFI